MPAIARVHKRSVVGYLLLLLILAAIMLVFVSLKTRKLADDVWTRLGVTETQANKDIISSYLNGHLYYYGAKNAKNIISNDRVAVVKQLVTYAKQYANSPDFRQQYEAYRAGKQPQLSVQPEVTPEMIRAQEKLRLENDLKTLEANINSPNEKLRNSIPARMEKTKKDLNELNDPDNKTVKMKMDQAARSKEYAAKAYNEALAKYEKEYPTNPQLLIKKRLEELLTITSDVDYSAELTEKYGKKVFVNPLYERKSSDWKLAFRAGKETTDAIRAIAQQWIQEIK